MRHTIYRRAIAILVVLLVFAQMGQVAFSYHQKQKEAAEAGQDTEQKALTLWYTDEKLNGYLVQAAADYKEQTGVDVTLQLVTAVDYIEHINTASISDPWKMTALRNGSFRRISRRRPSTRPPAAESSWRTPSILRPVFCCTIRIT